MATRQQAIDFLKSKYNSIEEVSENLYRIVFNTGNDRSQLVFVGFPNDRWIQISSRFASTDDLTPKQAFEFASEWICGIAKTGENYYVQNVVSLEGLDESDFVENLMFVTNIADLIEEKAVGGDEQ